MNARRETRADERAKEAAAEGHDRARDQRDQEESAFSRILSDLVARLPGAQAAAIVDTEGETVDYAGSSDPFSLRVTAAHWRIVLQHANPLTLLGRLQWLAVRSARRSFLVHALPEGYALVVALTRGWDLEGWQRAMATCCSAICEEAGWGPARTERPNADEARGARGPQGAQAPSPDRSRVGAGWHRIDIMADERRRPTSIRVGDRFYPVEILGSIVGRKDRGDIGSAAVRGSPRGARAWRVRLERGVELTVRRVDDGTWCADEPVDLLERPSGRTPTPTPTRPTSETPTQTGHVGAKQDKQDKDGQRQG